MKKARLGVNPSPASSLFVDPILFAVAAMPSVVIAGLWFVAPIIGIVVRRIIGAIATGSSHRWTAIAARVRALHAKKVLEREAAALAV